MSTITITIAPGDAGGYTTTPKTAAAGMQFDDNNCVLQFVRPTELAGADLVLRVNSANSNSASATKYEPVFLDASNEFTLPKSLTQELQLKIQPLFIKGDVQVNVPAFTLTFEASLSVGQQPIVRPSSENEGLVDAPSDGKTYGRKDGIWETMSVLPEAPSSDDALYGLKNGEWEEVPEVNGYTLVYDEDVTIETAAGTAVGSDSVIDLVEIEDGKNYTVKLLATEGTTGTSLADNDCVLALWDGATTLHEISERVASVGVAAVAGTLACGIVDAGDGSNQIISLMPLSDFAEAAFADASTDIMGTTALALDASVPVDGMAWKSVPTGTWHLGISVKAAMDASIKYRVKVYEMSM
jgi:hypothetical protein